MTSVMWIALQMSMFILFLVLVAICLTCISETLGLSKIITLLGCCLARQMAGQPLRALGLAQEKEVTTSLYSRVWLIWGSKPPKNNFYRRPLDKHVYTLGYPLQKNQARNRDAYMLSDFLLIAPHLVRAKLSCVQAVQQKNPDLQGNSPKYQQASISWGKISF